MGICGQCWSLARHEVENAYDADIDILLNEHRRMLVALRRIASGASLPITDEHPTALIRAEIADIAREAISEPNKKGQP